MKKKGLTYARLLIDVKEIDTKLLNTIYKNSIHSLLNEKIIIFNSDKKIIFSSYSKTTIKWKISDLKKIDAEKKINYIDNKNEILGFKYTSKNKFYYILISAEDIYGNKHLNFIFFIQISIFLVFTLLGIFLTLFIVKNTLNELNIFIKNISIINETNLKNRIYYEEKSKTEINKLSKEFNLMLDRIDNAYQNQREFTAQASHELKTPISRIISQLENLLNNVDESQKKIIVSILKNTVELNELIQSLLLLTKIESTNGREIKEIRIDEIIDETISSFCKIHPEFKISFEIKPSEKIYDLLYIKADQTQISIVISNLLKNAYLYSQDKFLNIKLFEINGRLNMFFINNGLLINEKDQAKLFNPFYRGENSQGKSGLGLGLRIVERILSHNNATIHYKIINNQNCFHLEF
jgi:signal transduction histidine kinase